MLRHLVTLIRTLRDDSHGLAMVEYAIAGSVITVAAVVAFLALGDGIVAGIERIVGVVLSVSG